MWLLASGVRSRSLSSVSVMALLHWVPTWHRVA
ncbi:hypothetical protein AZE42_12662, partial [Rhizopogon vesiculosus]